MSAEIKTWQIVDGKPLPLDSAPKDEKPLASDYGEEWLSSHPEIIGSDIVLIGRQVMTPSGPLDLLGIDKSGNTLIIEIAENELLKASLAQAIDYASTVAEWTVEKLDAICSGYTTRTLEDVFHKAFPDIDTEHITLNSTQRILLIGFSMEPSLKGMIEWLAKTSLLNINVILLNSVMTTNNDSLLIKTSLLSEEREQERHRRQKNLVIPLSDDPGTYESQELKKLLVDYLSNEKVTNRHMRDILLPACLRKGIITREDLEKEFIDFDPNCDEGKIGYYLAILSSQLGLKKNDFLRQVMAYEYRHRGEKDNFSIRDGYRDLVNHVLEELSENEFFRYFSLK